MADQCAICGKELGLLKYRPKGEWEIQGKLCKEDYFKKLNEARQAKYADRVQKAADEGKLVFDPEESDEDLVEGIMKSQMDLKMHEAGSSWMRVGTLLSGSSTDQMIGAGFKALIDLNKVIIRQNELMRRELKRLSKVDEGKDPNAQG